MQSAYWKEKKSISSSPTKTSNAFICFRGNCQQMEKNDSKRQKKEKKQNENQKEDGEKENREMKTN